MYSKKKRTDRPCSTKRFHHIKLRTAVPQLVTGYWQRDNWAISKSSFKTWADLMQTPEQIHEAEEEIKAVRPNYNIYISLPAVKRAAASENNSLRGYFGVMGFYSWDIRQTLLSCLDSQATVRLLPRSTCHRLYTIQPLLAYFWVHSLYKSPVLHFQQPMLKVFRQQDFWLHLALLKLLNTQRKYHTYISKLVINTEAPSRPAFRCFPELIFYCTCVCRPEWSLIARAH